MSELLKTIVALSHEFGTADYVLAGGGNSSCKDAATLWIKPSGTTLAGLTAENLVALERSSLARLYELTPPDDVTAREALVQQIMAAAVKPERPGRASVEAPVHDSFEARYVLHTHPTLVNGLTCALGGAAAAQRLFPDSLWLDYCDPGYSLSLKVRQALTDYRRQHGGREPRLMWLANHGLFVAGDEAADIRAAYYLVMERLQQEYAAAGVMLPLESATTPDSATTATTIALLQDELGTAADAIEVAPPLVCAAGPLTPDHIVYAKSYVYDGVVSAAGLAAFRERRGYAPRLVSTPAALYACGINQAAARRALEFGADGARVCRLARAFGGVIYLSDAARNFIESWEVESYRAKQL